MVGTRASSVSYGLGDLSVEVIWCNTCGKCGADLLFYGPFVESKLRDAHGDLHDSAQVRAINCPYCHAVVTLKPFKSMAEAREYLDKRHLELAARKRRVKVKRDGR